MYEMTIFIHYVLNPIAYVLITSELPRLRSLQKRKKAYKVLDSTVYFTVQYFTHFTPFSQN